LRQEALYSPVWGRSCHVRVMLDFKDFKNLKSAQLIKIKITHTILYIIFTITLVYYYYFSKFTITIYNYYYFYYFSILFIFIYFTIFTITLVFTIYYYYQHRSILTSYLSSVESDQMSRGANLSSSFALKKRFAPAEV
jgi:hypothetical protein